MRILVAGASGALGSLLVPALVAAGHDVLGTTRRQTHIASIAAHGARVVIMDALDPASVSSALEAAEPDVIVHELTDLAGFDYAGNDRLRRIGTKHLVAAAQDLGVDRMIAQSISWAYAPGEHPADEGEPLATDADGAPLNAGVAALEQSVATLSEGVVLRYGLLYGPGTWYAPGAEMFVAASSGRVDATSQHTSFVHIDDAVTATVAALNWPAGNYNIVDDAPTEASEWAPLFAQYAGFDGTPTVTARIEGRSASNAKARALGWSPRHPDWKDALRH